MWDLSSLTRDQTCTPCNGRPSLNHWTSREVTGKVIFQRVCTELTEKCHDGCCHCCAIAKSHLVWDTAAPAPGDRWGEHKRLWDAVKDSIVSSERMEAPNFKVKLNWRSGPYLLMLLVLSCFSRVRLCATLETAAHQAPPSLGFSRQEHWSGLLFPSPGPYLHDSKEACDHFWSHRKSENSLWSLFKQNPLKVL